MSKEELTTMNENKWPVYAVLMKNGDLRWYDTSDHAALRAENAALRARVEELGKVVEAARKVHRTPCGAHVLYQRSASEFDPCPLCAALDRKE